MEEPPSGVEQPARLAANASRTRAARNQPRNPPRTVFDSFFFMIPAHSSRLRKKESRGHCSLFMVHGSKFYVLVPCSWFGPTSARNTCLPAGRRPISQNKRYIAYRFPAVIPVFPVILVFPVVPVVPVIPVFLVIPVIPVFLVSPVPPLLLLHCPPLPYNLFSYHRKRQR